MMMTNATKVNDHQIGERDAPGFSPPTFFGLRLLINPLRPHCSPSPPLSQLSQPRYRVKMRITKAQLAGVDKYKYSGVDKSVVSKHVLGPFWTWLVTCFPKTLAPNTVSVEPCWVYEDRKGGMGAEWLIRADHFSRTLLRLCQCRHSARF
jgi:hypothetical protein